MKHFTKSFATKKVLPCYPSFTSIHDATLDSLRCKNLIHHVVKVSLGYNDASPFMGM